MGALYLAAWLALVHAVCSAATQKPLFVGATAVSPAATQANADRPLASGLHGRFLHITDIHPDPFYKAYSSTEEGIACHRGSGPAGYYGAETSDCDSPFSLVNATFDWIDKNLKGHIDFIIWTGDSARHDNDEHHPRTSDQVIGQNQFLVDKFREVFGNKESRHGFDIPIVPTFGNNDILPHNIFLKGPNKWTKTYADIWRPFIPEEQRHGFNRGGWFYVEVIPNKLAVFSLNTMYFFDSNNAVDGCASPSQPGYEHMEWLRIQLQFLRERGVKAILSGHVPPARNGEKIGWDETCWQKYTLWLQQYRDVVVGSLYGHMNIEHFIVQDFKDVDIALAAGMDIEQGITPGYEDDVSIQVKAPDYLMALRDIWSKLPAVPEDMSVLSSSDQRGSKTAEIMGRNKRIEEQKFYDKIGGEYAERFAISHITASVVPNFFSTMRVFEYNITGLQSSSVAAEPFSLSVPAWTEAVDDTDEHVAEKEVSTSSGTLTSSFNILRYAISNARGFSSNPGILHKKLVDILKHRKHRKHKHRKKKPKFTVPDPPTSTAPPGPAYSPQTLSWTGYKQYFANNTYLNNDLTKSKHRKAVDIAGWNPGRHVGKKPEKWKEDEKPSPRNFSFEVEYDTRDEKDSYRLGDGLTVRKWVELAARIGEFKGKNELRVEQDGDDDFDDCTSHSVDDDIIFDHFAEEQGDGPEGEDADDVGDSDAETEKNKKHKKHKHKRKKDKKKRKKRRKIANRYWFAFVSRAVTGTLSDEELHDEFGEADVIVQPDTLNELGGDDPRWSEEL